LTQFESKQARNSMLQQMNALAVNLRWPPCHINSSWELIKEQSIQIGRSIGFDDVPVPTKQLVDNTLALVVTKYML
jgi:hypothetical protein